MNDPILQASQAYKNGQRVYNDVLQLIQLYPTLLPRSKQYQQDYLLVLNGTIPVLYRGSTYNIPVSVQIPPLYPQQPPFAQVVPTEQMVLRPGQDVDQSGQYTHQCVGRAWRPNLTLVSVIAQMQQSFSVQPPVYSKPPSQTSTYAPVRMPQPMVLPATIPQQLSTAQSLPRYSQQQSNYTPLQMPSVQSPSYSDSPQSYGNWHNATSQTQQKNSVKKEEEFDTEHVMLISMRSALEDKILRFKADQESIYDTSLLKRIPGFPANLQSEMDRQLELNQRLQESVDKRNRLELQLKAESDAIDAALSQIDQKCREMHDYTQYLVNAQPQHVEQSLIPFLASQSQPPQSTSKVATQLFEAQCQDLALEDVLYQLARAYHKGLITDIDAYLKYVRRLANEQFLQRALAQKIRNVCGLTR